MMNRLALLALAILCCTGSTLDVSGMTLADVVAMLSQQTHQNIVLDPTLASQPVTMHVSGMSPDQVLNAIEKAYNLYPIANPGYTYLAGDKSYQRLGPSSTATLSVQNGNAKAIATILRASEPNLTVATVSPDTLMVAGSDFDITRARAVAENEEASASAIVHLTFLKPTTVVHEIQALGLTDATSFVVPNDQANSITIDGAPSFVRTVRTRIAQLDQAPNRASFRVEVLEVQPENTSSNTGIVWGSPNAAAPGATGQISVNPGTTATSFLNKTLPLAAQINALITHGQAKILADPSVSFNSNQASEFNFTTEYPIQISTGTTFSAGQLQYTPIGISLSLDGIVGPHKEITSTIDAIDSTIDGFDPNTHNPIIGKRETKTTVTVYPDESLVISGFRQSQDTTTTTGIPILSSIPVLGALFKDEQKTHQRLEVMFVITPSDVNTKGEQP